MSTRTSLAFRPNLAYILPVLPAGDARERAFVPERTTSGDRHPITSGLGDPEDWGRWLRYLPGTARRGDTLMSAPEGQPLLVVDRVGNGRIGVLMSDHVWLWSRGFDGGGPHRELLRRLVHWLMKEPELEEEALRGTIAADGTLSVTRQTLAETVRPITITDPDGTDTSLTLEEAAAGRFEGDVATALPGLYRLQTQKENGETLYALAASGEKPVREVEAILTTAEHVAPLAAATGGGNWTLATADSALPGLRRVPEGRVASGERWAGLVKRDVRAIESVRIAPLLPNGVWALLIIGTAVLAWLAEGRLFGRRQAVKET